MNVGLYQLIGAAAFWGLAHTAAGPDHYLPFVALGRANRWSYPRLVGITFFCGVGHVLSSVVLALVGGMIGQGLGEISDVQGRRGTFAAYLLLGFGVAYVLWGIRQARKGRRHTHFHVHPDGIVHRHEHDHRAEHGHLHLPQRSGLFWWLFIIFVLGPCESLIPLMLAAAGVAGVSGSLLVALAFSLMTVGTMLVCVSAAHFGLARLQMPWLERHAEVVAGAVMVLCALSILFLEPLTSVGARPPPA